MVSKTTYNQPILNLSLHEIDKLVISLGEKPFRARQVADWVYQHHINSYDEMKNVSKELREKLNEQAPLIRARIIEKQISADGTRKYLIEYDDEVCVEAVGLPTEDRLTVCMSSQAGCAMGCVFCATGQAGFIRNLYPGEMTEQVRLISEDFGRRVSNVVVMGQGEPFLNYDAVIDALRILNNPHFFNIGARHITISTCGIISGIERLAQEPEQFTLAISLHSAIQQTRDNLMPGVSQHKIPQLRQALIKYFKRTGRRPSLEYTVIEGKQTSQKEIDALVNFASGLNLHVNLIPVNSSRDNAIKPPSAQELAEIKSRLEQAHINVTTRTERGADIAAACGQLAQMHKEQ